jgi:hypothetical protein
MIIFAGIVAALPDALTQYLGARAAGPRPRQHHAAPARDRHDRRDLLLRARPPPHPGAVRQAQVGRKLYQGAQSFLPLKINVSGVIPPIFASSILMFPTQIASMSGSLFLQDVASVLHPADWRYNTIYAAGDLLCVLLYRGAVQPGRGRGQPEEGWRLHPRHPSGQEHRRVHREACSPASRSPARSTCRWSA